MAKSSKPQSLTDIVIDALEDIKAKDIRVLDVANITAVSDFIAIATADSNRQTRALAKNVIDKIREAGLRIYGTEGEKTGEWVLVDCGDIVVHIMQPAIREYYKLEELYQDAKLVFPRPEEVVTAKVKTVKEKPVVAKTTKTTKTTKKPAAKKVAVDVGKKVAKKASIQSEPKVTKAIAKVAKTAKVAKVAKTTAVSKVAKIVKVAKVAKVVKVAKVAKTKAVSKVAKTTSVAKKPAAKKIAAKKVTVKKVAAAKVAVKKVTTKKPPAKKVAAKKPVAKKKAT